MKKMNRRRKFLWQERRSADLEVLEDLGKRASDEG